jgi:TPR repeat protein
MRRRIATAFSVAFLVASAAMAGPLEDGQTAFRSGDYTSALKAWQPLADAGDAIAARNIGIMYDQGFGVTKSAADAMKWYRTAAEKGDAGGAFNLGLMLEAGDGAPANMAEAVKWFRVAGDAGDPIAQFKLGGIYAKGAEGVAKDDVEAVKWYLKAGEQNVPDAQFALGNIYATGRGVERDLSAANDWLERADKSQMGTGSITACTPSSVLRLEKCRRVVPRV